MLPFHNVVATDFDAVNTLIIDRLESDVELVENIGHYIVEAGGKRLRPLLVLLAARACGYEDGDQHIQLAAVIEFIHTATLLHDDVVDTSDLRRGRLTANARWGNAPSVLVGDFLYSRAFQMMVSLGDMAVMRVLADTTNVIAEGEVQQLLNARNPDLTEQDYFTVIDKKTAQLFAAASEIGALTARCDATRCARLREYGLHLGIAFQLVDDALDYQGDSEALGKNVGDDLAEGKATLPLIHAMRTSPAQAGIIREALLDGGLEQLDPIVTLVHQTGALDYTMACARDHADRAVRLLGELPDTPEKRALVELAQFSVNRSF